MGSPPTARTVAATATSPASGGGREGEGARTGAATIHIHTRPPDQARPGRAAAPPSRDPATMPAQAIRKPANWGGMGSSPSGRRNSMGSQVARPRPMAR
jgi:hypothetical protein